MAPHTTTLSAPCQPTQMQPCHAPYAWLKNGGFPPIFRFDRLCRRRIRPPQSRIRPTEPKFEIPDPTPRTKVRNPKSQIRPPNQSLKSQITRVRDSRVCVLRVCDSRVCDFVFIPDLGLRQPRCDSEWNPGFARPGSFGLQQSGLCIRIPVPMKREGAKSPGIGHPKRCTKQLSPRSASLTRFLLLEFPFHKHHKCQSYNQNSTRWLWNLGRRNRRRDWSVKNAARSRKPVPRCWKSVKRKFAGIRHSAISATQRLIHRRILYGWNGISYRKCRERNYDRSNLWARARRLPYAVSDCFSNYRHVVVPHSMNCSAAISPNLIKSHPNPLV